MNYAGIKYCDIANGLGCRTVLLYQAAGITVRAAFSRRHGNLTMESRLMSRYKTRYSTRLSLPMCRELPFRR